MSQNTFPPPQWYQTEVSFDWRDERRRRPNGSCLFPPCARMVSAQVCAEHLALTDFLPSPQSPEMAFFCLLPHPSFSFSFFFTMPTETPSFDRLLVGTRVELLVCFLLGISSLRTTSRSAVCPRDVAMLGVRMGDDTRKYI